MAMTGPQYFDMVRGIGRGYVEGQERGTRNALLRREIEQENQTRNLLAEYTMPGATPEAKQEALNTLLAFNPQAAAQVQQFEHNRQTMQRQQDQAEAQQTLMEAQYVMDGPVEGAARRLSLIDSDGSIRQGAVQMGLIPSADSVTDEQAMMIGDYGYQTAKVQLGPQGDDARVSAAIGDMQALGYPMTREGFKEYNQDKGDGSAAGLEALLAEARLRGLLMDQSRAEAEEQRQEEERRAARTAEEQSILRNLEQNMQAVELTESLEGTMLESGLPASDWRRGLASMGALVGSLTGQDTSELEQTIGNFDTQRKLLQDQVNARMASGDYSRSATQLESIQRSLASPDISPPAIIRIQGQLAQLDLDRADAKGIEIENREEYERRAKEWKEYSPLSASTISRMGLPQIEALDIDSLTDAQAEAALKRLEELER